MLRVTQSPHTTAPFLAARRDDGRAERDAVEARYNDHFRIFVKLWKGILSEKKELAAKMKEWESSKANLRGQTKKLAKAEQKVTATSD